MLSFSMRTSQKICKHNKSFRLSQSADETTKITKEENSTNNADSNNSSYFGVELQTLMDKQNEIEGLHHLKVPYFVHYCISKISSNLHSEGLFRISGRFTEIQEFQQQIDKTNDFGHSFFTNLQFLEGKHQEEQEISCSNSSQIHVFTGLIKKFLRELPNPLLGCNAEYSKWIEISKLVTTQCVSDLIVSITDILNCLPSPNVTLVLDILQLASLISEKSSVNLMDVDNLSRVIGPNLLWDHSILDPLLSTEHIFLVNSLTAFMITHVDLLTPDPETESDSDDSDLESIPAMALARGEETESDYDDDGDNNDETDDEVDNIFL